MCYITIADDTTEGNNIAVLIGVACGISVIVLILVTVLALYVCCVRKSSNENKYLVKDPPLADDNVYNISPGV